MATRPEGRSEDQAATKALDLQAKDRHVLPVLTGAVFRRRWRPLRRPWLVLLALLGVMLSVPDRGHAVEAHRRVVGERRPSSYPLSASRLKTIRSPQSYRRDDPPKSMT